MSKENIFTGPLKELNSLRKELDELQERNELHFRQSERRLTLASISDRDRAFKNPYATFNDLDRQHQWFSRAEEYVTRFFELMKKQGITYSKEEMCIQVLKEMKQEILADIKLLTAKKK